MEKENIDYIVNAVNSVHADVVSVIFGVEYSRSKIDLQPIKERLQIVERSANNAEQTLHHLIQYLYDVQKQAEIVENR